MSDSDITDTTAETIPETTEGVQILMDEIGVQVVEYTEKASFIQGLLQDSSFWVGVSFVLFLIVAYKLGAKVIVGGLDNKIQEIKDEIDNAERLRVEAQELLAQYQRKQRDAEKEAEEIVASAQKQAKEMQKSMQLELDELMARRETQVSDRLKRLEDSAISKIKNEAATVAMAATTEMIIQAMDAKTQKTMLDDSIKTVSNKLN
ncbi:MAG: hypothetical protein GW903_03235 [Alphaproteobacteria bacterium]|nr:hypothetical protein [Alphaproteobacteria bacterium]NCQ87983.1 hypothetical protein [Alphaproteobacteria bacterium]NCT05510.1 hypothetical protein [Alphaproteobacteria bacterium]